MAEFLIELYMSRFDGIEVEAKTEMARSAAEAMTQEGRPVRFVRSIFVPDDETWFLLFEAVSVEDVSEAARRAGLPNERAPRAVAGG